MILRSIVAAALSGTGALRSNTLHDYYRTDFLAAASLTTRSAVILRFPGIQQSVVTLWAIVWALSVPGTQAQAQSEMNYVFVSISILSLVYISDSSDNSNIQTRLFRVIDLITRDMWHVTQRVICHAIITTLLPLTSCNIETNILITGHNWSVTPLAPGTGDRNYSGLRSLIRSSSTIFTIHAAVHVNFWRLHNVII